MGKLNRLYRIYHGSGAILVVIIVLLASIYLSVIAPSGQKPPTPTPVAQVESTLCATSSSAIDSEENRMIGLINVYRIQNGLGALTVQDSLNTASAWMAEDMARNNYLSHTDSTGRNQGDRMIDCGYDYNAKNVVIGENLVINAQNTQHAFDSWLASPLHKANLLDPRWHSMGIARAPESSGKWSWTNEFSEEEAGSAGGISNTCAAGSLCDGVDLPGENIYHYPSDTDQSEAPSAAECQLACSQDNNCRAWTWVKPGVQGPGGVCWEKGSIPQAISNSNTVSGAKSNFTLPSGGASGGGNTGGGNTGGGGNPGASLCSAWPGGFAGCVAYAKQNYGTTYTCNSTCTEIIGSGGNTISPSVSISPSITRTTSPTNSPTPSPTRIPNQSPTTAVSPSPNPSAGTANTALTVTVKLKGIGPDITRGENSSPSANKQGQLQLISSSNGALQNLTAEFTRGNEFKAIFHPSPGTYTVKLRFDNTLWKNLGPASATAGQSTATIIATLVTGDLNQDNTLDLTDYNMLLSCYGTKTCEKKSQADLNLDTKVDEKDLNIFYSNLATRQGD